MSRPRASLSPEKSGMRDACARAAAALRGVKLTPLCGSLLAEAVNEISRPVASAQGAAVAQIHLTRDRRFRSRTPYTLLEPPGPSDRNGPTPYGYCRLGLTSG